MTRRLWQRSFAH